VGAAEGAGPIIPDTVTAQRVCHIRNQDAAELKDVLAGVVWYWVTVHAYARMAWYDGGVMAWARGTTPADMMESLPRRAAGFIEI
jgi:hypothetical protein